MDGHAASCIATGVQGGASPSPSCLTWGLETLGAQEIKSARGALYEASSQLRGALHNDNVQTIWRCGCRPVVRKSQTFLALPLL